MEKFWKIVKWVGGITLIVGLICGGGGVFVFPKIQDVMKKQREAKLGTLVDIEPAAHGELTRIVSAPGTVIAKTEVNITSRVSAKIIDLPYEAGDEVKEGEIIVSLDSKELEAQLAASQARLLADEAGLSASKAQLAAEEARLVGTKASLTKAVADWERSQQLFNSGDISQSELDSARAELDRQQAAFEAQTTGLDSMRANVEAAAARVRVAQADVDRAKENVDYCTIRAPITGVITRVVMREGEVALGTISNAGTPIMTMADLSEMLVRARIAEVDVARVREGQTAEVIINGYADETFNGTLRKLALQSMATSDGTNAFDAEIVLHLDGRRIFTGLTANVELQVETLGGSIIVPSQAVLDKRTEDLPKDVQEDNELVDPDKTFCRVVYTVIDGKAKVRPVKVVASNLLRSAISAGLEPGEQVIVGPYRALQSLADGQSIRLEEEKKEEGEESKDEAVAEEGEQTTESGDVSTAGAS